jgi:TrkA domain protein
VAEIAETQLPGVGVRYEFSTASGERVGVLSHRSGHRELVVYGRNDPDRSTTVIHLSPDDTRTLGEILGTSHVSTTVAAVQQQLEGVAIEWLTVEPGSPFAGATIADGQFRTKTGTSIVAVIRGDLTIPAPGPEHRFEGGDIAVAVGTPRGLEELRSLLNS